MKRYMTFAWHKDKPQGGMFDYIGGANFLGDAKSLASAECQEYGPKATAHIWDIILGKVVARYDPLAKRWGPVP